MIIFEGPDGAGKTYSAEWLSNFSGIPLYHAGGPPTTREEILSRIEHMLQNRKQIFDRFPLISEPIYGPIIRGSCLLTPDEILSYLCEMKTFAKIVYCRPSVKTILSAELKSKPHKSSDHTEAVKMFITEIINAYDESMSELSRLRLRVYLFDRDKMNLEDLKCVVSI